MEGILFPKGVPEGREALPDYRARGGYEALAKAARGISRRCSSRSFRTLACAVMAAPVFPPEKNGSSPAKRRSSRATW